MGRMCGGAPSAVSGPEGRGRGRGGEHRPCFPGRGCSSTARRAWAGACGPCRTSPWAPSSASEWDWAPVPLRGGRGGRACTLPALGPRLGRAIPAVAPLCRLTGGAAVHTGDAWAGSSGLWSDTGFCAPGPCGLSRGSARLQVVLPGAAAAGGAASGPPRARRGAPRATRVSCPRRYVGELISDSEADVREEDSYLFDLDNKVVRSGGAGAQSRPPRARAVPRSALASLCSGPAGPCPPCPLNARLSPWGTACSHWWGAGGCVQGLQSSRSLV